MIFQVPIEYSKKVCSVCHDTDLRYGFDNRRGVHILRRLWCKDKCMTCNDRIRHYGKRNWQRKRNRVMDKVGRGIIKCVNCGCNRRELLEINHKNGGGTQENNRVGPFICDILAGRRSVEDLNLLCKVCNSLHYLELKYGKLPFTVRWGDC